MRTSDAGSGQPGNIYSLDVRGAEKVACCRINPGLAFCEAGVTKGWVIRQVRLLLKWRPDLVGIESKEVPPLNFGLGLVGASVIWECKAPEVWCSWA